MILSLLPRDFSQEGKFLRLKKNLCGLKQSPHNFFQRHLTSKLESIELQAATDIDSCLFFSDKVICLCYVDDILLFSPEQERINEAIERNGLTADPASGRNLLGLAGPVGEALQEEWAWNFADLAYEADTEGCASASRAYALQPAMNLCKGLQSRIAGSQHAIYYTLEHGIQDLHNAIVLDEMIQFGEGGMRGWSENLERDGSHSCY